MKIHQIPMGTRFVYEGEEYAKTGPMVASGKAGQRLIPKHAVLMPLGEAPKTHAAVTREPLERAAVIDAFEQFYARCVTLVPTEKQGALEVERAEFLKRL